MTTVKAEFDGRVFIPCQPVQLPPGTAVEVIVPDGPRQLSAEELREWQETLRELSSSEPYFSTLEEAMRYSRKRP